MGFFGATHGCMDKKAPLSKICHTYPTLLKLGAVIPYLKNIEKAHKSRDTLEFLSFADISIFSPKISNF